MVRDLRESFLKMMISFFFWWGECRAAFVEHLGTRAVVSRRTFWTRNSKNDRITEKWSPKCLHQKISRSVKVCPCPSKLTKSDGKKWWKSSVKSDLLPNIRSSVREYVSLNKKEYYSGCGMQNEHLPSQLDAQIFVRSENQKLLITSSKNNLW